MTPNGRRVTGICALVVIGLIGMWVDAQARVFMRWGGGERQSLRQEETHWTLAREEAVTLNGQAHAVQVFGVASGAGAPLEAFRERYTRRGAAVAVFPRRELSWGLAVWPDERYTAILLVSSRILPRTVAFLLHGHGEKTGPTEKSIFSEWPVYPGARPGSQLAQPDRNTYTGFWRTTAPANAVRAFYAQELSATGWTPVLQEEPFAGPSSGPLLVYRRHRQLCIIQISPIARPGNERMITVVVQAE